ncbi:hypothetical protein [Pseudoxanthomonas wuyuanensis]
MRSVLMVPFLALLVAGNAQAQWQVVDNELIRNSERQWDKENDARDDIIERLDSLRTVGSASSAGEKAEEPEELLNADQPSQANHLDESKRCPTPSASGVAQQQWQFCQEIVRTELAQYKYSLKMYELTKKRHERLVEIERERENLGSTDEGKLQDNTNKLLALLSLMEIDRQQQKTYMDAYAARLHYLRESRDLLTEQALRGAKGGSLGDTVAGSIGGLIGGGVMAAALEAVRTERRYPE